MGDCPNIFAIQRYLVGPMDGVSVRLVRPSSLAIAVATVMMASTTTFHWLGSEAGVIHMVHGLHHVCTKGLLLGTWRMLVRDFTRASVARHNLKRAMQMPLVMSCLMCG